MVLGWRAIDGYLPAIRKVSAADILRVAKRYFTPDNRTVAVLVPLTSTKTASRLPGSPAGEQVIE
jgi:predicted Zn-dependent peptidase